MELYMHCKAHTILSDTNIQTCKNQSLKLFNSSYTWQPFVFSRTFKVVHLEIMQGGALNTLIPNNISQHSVSQKPALPLVYCFFFYSSVLFSGLKKRLIILHHQSQQLWTPIAGIQPTLLPVRYHKVAGECHVYFQKPWSRYFTHDAKNVLYCEWLLKKSPKVCYPEGSFFERFIKLKVHIAKGLYFP